MKLRNRILFPCLTVLLLAGLAPCQDLLLERPKRPARVLIGDSPGNEVNSASFSVSTSTLPGAIQEKEYSQTLATVNGFPPFAWTVSAGQLPNGLSLSSSGTISGVPTVANSFAFTVRVTDVGGRVATKAFSVIVSSNGSAYGNVGDPYATEGGAPNPTPIVLTTCQATTLQTNKAYRLGQDLTAATPGTICLIPNAGTKIDLGGFTLTGRIAVNGDINGISVFNGTINCTWADSGSNAGCVRLVSNSPVTSPLKVHHLNLTNNGAPSRSMHIEWNVATKFAGGVSVRVFNLTAFVPSQPLVGRSFALSIIATNQTPEFFNNDLTCAADAAACQGIMCFGTGECKFHHNRINLIFNTTAQNGRGLLFDGGVPSGEAWNNEITASNNRAIRVRDSANIRIHNNRILNIQPNGAGTIHLADPDAGKVNDLNVLIDDNDFQLAGGVVIFQRNGFNATAKNNRFTCLGTCSQSTLSSVRTPLAPGTQSVLTLENNPDVILHMAPPHNLVQSGATLNTCNSGQTGGVGTIVVTCPP